jgi:nucleoside diphosphate kinase
MSDNISALEKFRNQSCPNFMFFFSGTLVKIVRGANAPLIEKTIKEQVELEKKGHAHASVRICVPSHDFGGVFVAVWFVLGHATFFLPYLLNVNLPIVFLQWPLDETTQPLADLLAPKTSESDQTEVEGNRRISAYEFASNSGLGAPTNHGGAGAGHGSNGTASGADNEALSPSSDAPLQHTLAIIKPDAMHPSIIEEVYELLHRNRITITAKRKLWLTKEQVAELYREHDKKEWFEQLLNYMSSAPILALHLTKENVIQLWRDILGPKDPRNAKMDAPKSLRAQYGTDSLTNAFHASDGEVSAHRELGYLFPSASSAPTEVATEGEAGSTEATPDAAPVEGEAAPPATDAPAAESAESAESADPSGTDGAAPAAPAAEPTLFTELPVPEVGESKGLTQKTVAIIKPEAYSHVETIIGKIVSRGYQVSKREEVQLSVERAAELIRLLKADQIKKPVGTEGEEGAPEEVEITEEELEYWVSGPIVCLVVKGEEVISGWREMIGPEDPEVAKKELPMS